MSDLFNFMKTILAQTGLEEFYFASINNEKKIDQKRFQAVDLAYQWINENLDKNLYFGVSTRFKNFTDTKKSSCKSIKALFLDIDFKMKGNENQEEVLERIQGFPLEPTFLIHSGNGYHLYWALPAPIELNEEKVKLIEETLKGICKNLNGDPSPCQVAQIMRVPNTFNVKDPKNPKPVKIIKASDKVYSFEAFSEYRIEKVKTNSELDWSDELVTEEQINLKFNTLSKKLQDNLISYDGEDRSKIEFGIVMKLLKNDWLPNEIFHASQMEKFKNGLGKKTQEENRPDYIIRTIESAYRKLIENGHIFERNKSPLIQSITAKIDPSILDHVYFDETNQYYFINEKEVRPISGEDLKRILKVFFYKENDTGGLIKDRKIINFQNEIKNTKKINTFEVKPVPFCGSKVSVQNLPDGTHRVVSYISILDYFKNILSNYDEIKVSEKLSLFMESKYPEIIDIFKASINRLFCKNKKSKIWLHCNSDYGKTFFLYLESISFKFEIELDKDLFKGNEPEYFIRRCLFFIDEPTRFPKELKNDSFTYKKLYSGIRTIECPLIVLGSKDPIKDLEGGTDEQLQNRVTKIAPNNKNLVEELLKIGETPQSIRTEYEKFIIEILIKEIEVICQENKRYDIVADERYNLFLKKYECNLEKTNISQLVFDEVQNLLSLYIGIDSSKECIVPKISTDNPKNPFIISAEDTKVKKLFIRQPQEFLNKFLYPALGDKQYTAKRSIPTNERFGNLFSEYKKNSIDGSQIRSIELHYKIENKNIILFKKGDLK